MTDLNERERVERAFRAKRALEEFIDPAFEVACMAYSARLEEVSATQPWEAGKITALANAVRILKEVRSQVTGVIMDGEVAKSEMIRAEKIEKLTPSRRRLLNIGPF